jgi:transcriptional regulator with XRE-family HTH domain
MNTRLGFPQHDTFGGLLRRWRTTRRLSQLTLATEAGISTRHLSFLETGRAQPSREMVQLLIGMLDVPPGERNALLVSAGYAPVYGEQPDNVIGSPELEPVRRPLQFILNQQEPFPAIVLDGHWNIVMGNEASTRIFGLFKDRGDHDGANVMRTVFDPGRLRRFILNWEEVAQCLMHSLHREVAATGSEGVVRLRDEVLAYPGVPSRWAAPDQVTPMPPLATMRMRKDDVTLAFFSTVTTFATPRDLALQQLKIECFFPADTVTEQFARRLAYRAPVAV